MTAALRSDEGALDAVAALLGPDRPSGGATRSYLVLPRRRRPRYLVPVAGRPAGAAHIRPAASGRDVVTRLVLRPALRLGAARLVPGAVRVDDGTDADPSLRRHLAALLDDPALDLAVALGAPRPNRKPVLQAVDGRGRTRAWVKVGVDEHTDRLVAHEADALTRLRPGPPVRTPEVLAAGEWRGHPLLALAHLDMTEAPGALAITPGAAAALVGPTTTDDAVDGPWWRDLRARLAAEGIDPDGRAATVLDRLEPALAGRRWPFGAWHGDLAPWNATWEGDELVVWDWERAAAPVPAGLDVVHNRVQVALLREGATLADAAAGAAAGEAATLATLGHRAEDVPLVVAAYLATLRVRYAEDERLGPLGPGAPIAAAIDDTTDLGLEAAP